MVGSWSLVMVYGPPCFRLPFLLLIKSVIKSKNFRVGGQGRKGPIVTVDRTAGTGGSSAKLRQVDVLTGQGKSIAEAVKTISVTETTYFRWRAEYGGLKSD